MPRWNLIPLLSLVLFTASAQAKETKDFPEIISVYSEVSFEGKNYWGAGRCTGTWIAPRFLLTASHCVRHFNATKINGRVYRATGMNNLPAPDLTATPQQVYVLIKKWWGTKKLHPIAVHVSPNAIPVEHGDFSLDHVEQDLAILEFAQAWPVTPREVATQEPSLTDPVTLVGFGHHGPNIGGGAGFGGTLPIKNFGHNTISMVDLDMIVSNGSPHTCDEVAPYFNDWAICPGDSGGPLLDASGKVLGVASTSADIKHYDSRGERKLSVYIDVTSGEAADFIRETVKRP